MKYAIVGPRGRIFRILDEPNARTVEISDALAAKAAAMRNAILHDGDVTNPQLQREAGFKFQWNEAVGEWERTAIVLPVPSQVSARQIRLWLVAHGVSMATVEAAIDSIEDAATREAVRVEWEYAPYVERTHAWLVPMASALGFTSEQIDQAFREASTL
jgi:hypothetical protein